MTAPKSAKRTSPPSPTEVSASEQKRLALLYRISREISSRLNLEDLLPRLLKETVDNTRADTGSLIVFGDSGAPLHSAIMVNGKFEPDPDKHLAATLDNGLAGWVVENRQATLVRDTTEDRRWEQHPDDELLGPKSAICAPLWGRERVVGVMTIVKLPADSFGKEDLSLLAAIADQAGTAIENAQLFSNEQRRREINSILREISRNINTTLDMQQVLHLVLEQLARVIHYDSASILLREADNLRISAARGFEDAAAVNPVSFDASRGLSSRAVQEKRCIILTDVRESPEWIQIDLPEAQAIRSWIGAPLIVKDEVVGLLCVDNHRPGAYTEEDGQVVTAIAEQAATAVVNARLFAESQRRLQAVQALATASQAINATLQLDEVLQLLVKYAYDLLRVEAASIALIENGRLVFKEALGPAAQAMKERPIRLGQGIAGWVAQNNEAALVPDADADDRFFRGVDEQTGFVTRAIACVPVQIKDRVIGIIEVMNPVEGTFDPGTLNLLDSLGSLAGTAIVHAQWVADLQAAESRYAGLFEDSIDPILITDLNGVIMDANHRATEFFGYQRAELIGLRVTTVHRTGTAWLGSDRFKTLRDGKQITYQTRITAKTGDEIPVEVHAKLIQRNGSEFIQWIQHDISERLALEEMRNDLISMLFHDLRSPLGNIISSLDVVMSSLPEGNEMEHSLLSIANRSAARLSRLVDSLLDLRRLETGQVVLGKEQTNVNSLVAEAVEQVHANAEGKGIQLKFDIPPRLPYANIDADMIRRVIINLLENAIKYMPGAGTVTVIAKAEPKEILVSVADTGPGIARNEHTRIFNRFARIQRDAAPKGMGLGLAFCRLAVEAHGGRIWVDSQPGRGATFSFTLPFLD